MARPGPAGKDKARFQLVAGGRPEMPDGWQPETISAWQAFWGDVASEGVAAKDHPAVLRLFQLRDDIVRFLRLVEVDGDLVTGSTGQPVLHPLRKQADGLLSEVRMLEDRFGLNPKAGLGIGLQVQAARRGLADLSDLEEEEG